MISLANADGLAVLLQHGDQLRTQQTLPGTGEHWFDTVSRMETCSEWLFFVMLLEPQLLAVQRILCAKAPALFSEVHEHEGKVTR